MVFCRPDLPAHVTVRLLKKRNKNGEVQVFCTSLLDTKKYDRKSIINLYHQRWNIEEAYKFIKTRLDIEDWSGKTALSVKQDFFAKTLLLTLCNIMCFKIKPKLKGNPLPPVDRPMIINRTYAMHQLKKSLYNWCSHIDGQLPIEIFRTDISFKPEFSRKGSVPRNKNLFTKFAMNYKSV
ncbi:MAG: transposase [Flammeovirgaceae bacterium]